MLKALFGMLVGIGSAVADGGGGSTSRTPEEVEEQRDASDALAAETTVPQFAARRGGTLGIPAASSRDGLQAAIDILNSEQTANGFVALEGVEITSRLLIAVVAETFEESLPRAVLGAMPAVTELYLAKLPSVGARAKWTSNAIFTASAFQSAKCIAALGDLLPAQYTRLLGQGNGTEGKDEEEIAKFGKAKGDCSVEQLGSRSQRVFSLGLRVLRRGAAKESGAFADGLAGEVAYLRELSNARRLMSYYVSPSFLWLQRGAEELAGSAVEYPGVFEARLSAGFEYRGMKLLAANAAPRVGVYGTAAWNWWHNEYNFGTVDSSIRGSQFEAGVYFSARAGGGLHGLISLSVLEPFGNTDAPQILLSFSQSVSSNGTTPAGAPGGGT